MSKAQAKIEEEKKVEQEQPVQENAQNYADLIEKFKRREIELYELPKDLQSQLLDPTVEEIQLEEPVEQDSSHDDSEKEKAIDWKKRFEQIESKHKDLQGRYAQKSNESNAANQKLLSIEYRLKNDPAFREKFLGAETQNAKTETKEENLEDIDVYDEQVLRDLYKKAKRVEELEAKLSKHEQFIQEAVGEKKQTLQHSREENLYSQFEDLQNSVESLKTEMPFRQIDQIYASFYNHSTGTLDKNSVLASGVSEDDFNKYQVLASFNNPSYPSVRAAFRDSDYFETNQKQPTNNAVEASKKALDSKVDKLQNQSQTLTSSYSTGTNAADKGTVSWALNWLKDHPHQELYGPEDIDEHKRCMKILKGV